MNSNPKTQGQSRPFKLPLLAAALGLSLGGAARLFGATSLSQWAWGTATASVLIPSLWTVVSSLRKRELSVDLIAILAMAGALALGQFLAGAIIALMLTGGTALEAYANRRARRELTALLGRAPRIAHRRAGDEIEDIAVTEIGIGDALLVKQGEVIPTDGLLLSESAVLDESALTGESKPSTAERGTSLRSGAANAGPAFEMRATAAAAESTYESILRLVRAAEESKPRLVRMADRYAVWLVALTIAVAGIAWALSGDVVRALAVLVVATPCPLLLAVPSAIVAGVSRAARHGIIIKGGAPLEALAQAKVLLLDKTGTITAGQPRVVAVEMFSGVPAHDLLHLAASLELLSTHPFAPALLAEARSRGIPTSFPSSAQEHLGAGIGGFVDGRQVRLGQISWVAPESARSPQVKAVQLRTSVEGSSSVFVAVDGILRGALILQDPIRTEAPRVLRSLRKLGIQRIHLLTGDYPDVAELVGDVIGVDRVHSEHSPEDKVNAVRLARSDGPTVMVGDGINDAPALALADVGVAMGARGATAASEAADVVLVVDRLEALVWAVRIARRARAIALQSAMAGMALSLIAMIAAAAGLLPPTIGALVQEVIDLAVILNSLRALSGRLESHRPKPIHRELARDLEAIHHQLRPQIAEIPTLASSLDSLPAKEAYAQLLQLRTFLTGELLPHERKEQATAYPVLSRIFAGEDPTGPLINTHGEIARLVRLYSRSVEQLSPETLQPENVRDLRRLLYGLHAVLTLHFAQEDELYLALAGTEEVARELAHTVPKNGARRVA